MSRLSIKSSGGGGSGAGGIRKVSNAAARLALTPADGDFVIQLDTDTLYYWNGATWEIYLDDSSYDDLLTVITGLSDHLADTSDAHDASAISNVPSGNLAATDVQGALNELQTNIDSVQSELDGDEADLAAHLADTVDAHDASAISNIPSGNLAASNVQTALNELQSNIDAVQSELDGDEADLATHIANGTGAHAATAISFSPTGTIAAINAQTAIAEVASEADTRLIALEAIDHVAISLAAFGSTANANGASLSGTDSQTITLQPASVSFPGGVSTAAQTFAGSKSIRDGLACGASGAPNAKLAFEVVTTSKSSFPAPSMTTTQRDALSAPLAGSQVYNSTTGQLETYNGTNWEPNNGYAVPASTTVSDGGTLTLSKYKRQILQVAGNAAPAAVSVVHTALIEGSVVVLLGTSDANTITFSASSVLVLNGSCTLGLDDTLQLVKVSTKLYETSRSE